MEVSLEIDYFDCVIRSSFMVFIEWFVPVCILIEKLR